MTLGLFNFHVDNDGAAELISIIESAPLVADPNTPLVIGGTPSTTMPPTPSEEDPKLETSTPSVGSNDFQYPPPSPTTAYCIECDAYHFVGTGDFSSHEIAGCEDPRGALLPSTRQYPSANGLSTPSRSNLRLTTLITSRGYTQTTRAQTTTSILRPRGRLAIHLVHTQASSPYLAADTWSIMILIQ
jgi:hypothetical protein